MTTAGEKAQLKELDSARTLDRDAKQVVTAAVMQQSSRGLQK